MADAKNAIQIDGLCYTYNSAAGINALDNINLSIAGNEFIAVIGENGSGKTTLLKNITGLLRPSKGAIYLYGKDSREMSVSAISKEIGFVMQNPDRQLFADTVHAEVAFALKNAKLAESEIKRRVENALAEVELSDKRDSYPPAMSRGERAKVVIASVIAMEPKIIILDEPTGGQDYRSGLKIMDIATRLHDKGRAIIFVTHNMPLACAYARRIIVMREQRVVMDGSAEDIFCHTPENAHILPPQITRLSRELRKKLPLPKDALTVPELGEMLTTLA